MNTADSTSTVTVISLAPVCPCGSHEKACCSDFHGHRFWDCNGCGREL